MSWTLTFQNLLVLFTFLSLLNFWSINNWEENGEHFCILVCNFFTTKCGQSSWENLVSFQCQFQPIKFGTLICSSQSLQDSNIIMDHRRCLMAVKTKAPVHTIFVPHFDVICDLHVHMLLNRCKATWRISVKMKQQVRQNHSPGSYAGLLLTL